MAGLMDGLAADAYDRQYTNAQLYQRILGRLRAQRGPLLTMAGLLFAQSAANTGVPLLISHALDLLSHDPSEAAMAVVVAASAGLASLAWGFNYALQSLSSRAVGRLVQDLRVDALRATVARDMRFFDQNLPGKLVSRITGDTQEMGALVTLVSDMLSSLLLVGLVSAVMLYMDVTLGLLALSTAPLIWGATLLFRRSAREMSTQSRRIIAELTAQVGETVSGISLAKAFGQEQVLFDAFKENNARGYDISLRQGWVMNTIFPTLNMLSGLGTAVLIYFGGGEALLPASGVTPGEWYFFMQAVGVIFFPLTSLASFYSQLQNGLSSTERVFALLEGKSELRQADPGRDPGRLRGEIQFKDVHFAYKQGEPVFDGLTLHIPAGQSVALVGHTGAGKSSIVSLLSRYYEFERGQITVDGHDLRELDLGAWRRQLGVILQEQLLFDATVAENICYGLGEVSEARAREALEKIGAASLIDDLPQGLSTPVRERGARLSLGQRQLISLARTLLMDPAVLVLDEATASVDPLTEVQLQRALERVMKGRTTLVVAHRLTTIRGVDRIIALDKGNIAEEGNHDALMRKGGYYATLYNTYYRHQSLEYIEEMGRLAG